MSAYGGEQRQGGRAGGRGGAGAKPTIKQIYAVARALCECSGEAFPETKAAASELIGRLRGEQPGTKEAA
jgi:hypothetical protein